MPDQPITSWPGDDDRSVVAEMLADLHSPYWEECDSYVEKQLRQSYPFLSSHLKQEMQQETMMSVHRKLAEFRFDSRLTTWLFVIIRNKFNDTQRKINQITKLELPPKDSPDDSEDEENIFRTDVSSSPLEVLLILEELDEVKVAIEEFIGQHRNQERNRRIITMVLFENRTCEDTAKILGINAPVVSYVVRDVRKALREKFPDRTWHLIGKLHKFDR